MLLAQLKQLGLSEKEAKVYLAALELGSSSVMEISRKAGINRPTTYFQIESLMKRGLMSSVTRGKKRYFAAEPPNRLLRLLELKEKEIEEQEERFKKILPELQALFNMIREKPKVRFFEGIEGLKAIQEDIIKTKSKSIEEITNLDEAYKVFPPHPGDHRHKMAKKFRNIPIKTIYTSKKGPILPYKENTKLQQFVPFEEFPFSAHLVIYGEDKTAVFSLKNRLVGVIIEDKEITSTLRYCFKLAWEGAKKYKK